jgi:hypothetical protein
MEGMTALRFDALAGTTLDHVSVDWRNATARLTFLPAKGSHEAQALRVTELTLIHVDRTAKAGRLVKEAKGATAAHGAKASLTMESGEVLQIEGGTIVLEVVGG